MKPFTKEHVKYQTKLLSVTESFVSLQLALYVKLKGKYWNYLVFPDFGNDLATLCLLVTTEEFGHDPSIADRHFITKGSLSGFSQIQWQTDNVETYDIPQNNRRDDKIVQDQVKENQCRTRSGVRRLLRSQEGKCRILSCGYTLKVCLFYFKVHLPKSDWWLLSSNTGNPCLST